MSEAHGQPGGPGAEVGRGHESPDEKHDRQLIELLNELRLALPGVQMLFGFMLAVPFSQRFQTVTDRQLALFYVALLTTAAASICFITPASFHRIIWRHGMKAQMLSIASVLAVVGTAFLGVAMTCVVALLSSFLYNNRVAVVATTVVGSSILVLWFAVPLALRIRRR